MSRRSRERFVPIQDASDDDVRRYAARIRRGDVPGLGAADAQALEEYIAGRKPRLIVVK